MDGRTLDKRKVAGSNPATTTNFMNKYEYVKRALSNRMVWFNSLKDKPCADCGIQYPPYVMEFHHLDPTLKMFGLGQGRFREGRERILAEIAKCVLLCANCHRHREYGLK